VGFEPTKWCVLNLAFFIVFSHKIKYFIAFWTSFNPRKHQNKFRENLKNFNAPYGLRRAQETRKGCCQAPPGEREREREREKGGPRGFFSYSVSRCTGHHHIVIIIIIMVRSCRCLIFWEPKSRSEAPEGKDILSRRWSGAIAAATHAFLWIFGRVISIETHTVQITIFTTGTPHPKPENWNFNKMYTEKKPVP